MTDDAYAFGDEVYVDGRPAHKQPHIVRCQFHSGQYRLHDKYGGPLVGIAPERLTAVAEGESE